jgi:4-hydroxy-4-methyl-2-oxoglutarate aldolase
VISSSAIAEAVERVVGTQAHMTADLHVIAGGAFAGPAVTLRLVRDDGASSTDAAGAAIALIESSPPGSVVVAVLEQDKGFAVFGSTLAMLAKTRQLAGFVVDGAVRDVADLRAIGLPTFARGAVPGSAGGHYRVAATNVAVRCGGIDVRPGDIVVGDEDGIAAAPRERYDEILVVAAAWQEDKRALLPLIAQHGSYAAAMRARSKR